MTINGIHSLPFFCSTIEVEVPNGKKVEVDPLRFPNDARDFVLVGTIQYTVVTGVDYKRHGFTKLFHTWIFPEKDPDPH